MRKFLSLAENGVASQEKLCSIELVNYADIYVYVVVVFQITKILKSLLTVLYSSRLLDGPGSWGSEWERETQSSGPKCSLVRHYMMLASQLQVTPPLQRITPCLVYTLTHSFTFRVLIYSFLSVQVFQSAVHYFLI
jgi:hypothetical protein